MSITLQILMGVHPFIPHTVYANGRAMTQWSE